MSEKPAWLDKRKNVMLLIRIFLGICVVVLLLDLVFHRHELFSWEGWFGFHGFYGFDRDRVGRPSRSVSDRLLAVRHCHESDARFG